MSAKFAIIVVILFMIIGFFGYWNAIDIGRLDTENILEAQAIIELNKKIEKLEKELRKNQLDLRDKYPVLIEI